MEKYTTYRDKCNFVIQKIEGDWKEVDYDSFVDTMFCTEVGDYDKHEVFDNVEEATVAANALRDSLIASNIEYLKTVQNQIGALKAGRIVLK